MVHFLLQGHQNFNWSEYSAKHVMSYERSTVAQKLAGDRVRLFCHARIGSLESGNLKMSAHQFSGRFLSPHVFSAYNTLFSKSRRFLTLINAFLRLWRKKAWDGKKFMILLMNTSRSCDNHNFYWLSIPQWNNLILISLIYNCDIVQLLNL